MMGLGMNRFRSIFLVDNQPNLLIVCLQLIKNLAKPNPIRSVLLPNQVNFINKEPVLRLTFCRWRKFLIWHLTVDERIDFDFSPLTKKRDLAICLTTCI